MSYLMLKYIHILSGTLLFGTGLGTAFFMLMAYFSKDMQAIRVTTKNVVLADTLFTLPTVIIQPITGIYLMLVLNYQFDTLWFALVVALYIFAGLCWLRVVWIQFRFKRIALLSNTLTHEFHRLMWEWIILGCIAFIALVIVYWLMVFKTGLGEKIFQSG
jgi:uncharacterized membrane protein